MVHVSMPIACTIVRHPTNPLQKRQSQLCIATGILFDLWSSPLENAKQIVQIVVYESDSQLLLPEKHHLRQQMILHSYVGHRQHNIDHISSCDCRTTMKMLLANRDMVSYQHCMLQNSHVSFTFDSTNFGLIDIFNKKQQYGKFLAPPSSSEFPSPTLWVAIFATSSGQEYVCLFFHLWSHFSN